jgi:hypothetical protein
MEGFVAGVTLYRKTLSGSFTKLWLHPTRMVFRDTKATNGSNIATQIGSPLASIMSHFRHLLLACNHDFLWRRRRKIKTRCFSVLVNSASSLPRNLLISSRTVKFPSGVDLHIRYVPVVSVIELLQFAGSSRKLNLSRQLLRYSHCRCLYWHT